MPTLDALYYIVVQPTWVWAAGSAVGVPGEAFDYKVRRDGVYFIIYEQTASGRLLTLVGEDLESGFRVFAARDMSRNEKRRYRTSM